MHRLGGHWRTRDRAAQGLRRIPGGPLGPVAAYLLMRLKVRLAYRVDFALNAVGDLVATAAGLVLVATIFHHVPEVAGYTLSEVLLCWGFAEASAGLFFVLFQGLYAANEQYVVGGELDRVLLRPLDPYLQILLDHVNLEDLPVVLLGLGVLLVGAWDVAWTPSRVVLLPVFLACGALLTGGLLTAVSAVGFLFRHRGTAIGLASQVSAYARYPLDFLPRPVALVVSTVLPFAFTGFLPATWYMERPEWWPIAALQPIIGLGVFLFGYGVWRLGLRHYASSGT